MEIHFQIITPEQTVFEDVIDSVSITTRMGQVTILPHHRPLLSRLAPGEMIIRQGAESFALAVYGGFLEVLPDNKVIVLADASERVESIDVEEAQAAVERAKKVAEEKFAAEDYEDAALALQRELARFQIAKKYRTKGIRTSK